jgi:hypothetical protein
MRKIIVCAFFLLASAGAYCQHTYFTLSSGYTNANVQDGSKKGTGYRINTSYEINPADVKWTLGISAGFLHLTGSTTTRNYEVTSVPFYFSPKYMFGNDEFKVYIKGAAGAQYSKMSTTGTSTNFSDHDFGFAGGGGTGFMYFVNEKIFLNAEYELLWVSNKFYRDGLTNTFSGGIGWKF